MRRFTILLAAFLSLSLLSGCMPAIVVTSPKDEELQQAWDESMEELRRNLQEDREAEEDDSWSAWVQAWETWGAEAGDRFSDEGKTHRWKVLDAGGQELAVISDEKAVKALDDLMLTDDDSWKRLAKDPGEPAYTYVFSQEETIKAGQNPDGERAYEDLMTFTVSATENVVTVQILGGLENLSLVPSVDLEDVLTFYVSVPAETAEALRNPESFS